MERGRGRGPESWPCSAPTGHAPTLETHESSTPDRTVTVTAALRTNPVRPHHNQSHLLALPGSNDSGKESSKPGLPKDGGPSGPQQLQPRCSERARAGGSAGDMSTVWGTPPGRVPTLTQELPNLVFLNGRSQVLLELRVSLEETPFVQEDEDVPGGQHRLVHGEAVHVLEGLHDGGPVPEHGVERREEAGQLGGGQGRPVGSQRHTLSESFLRILQPRTSAAGQCHRPRGAEGPPTTRVTLHNRHRSMEPTTKNRKKQAAPAEARWGPESPLHAEGIEISWKPWLTGRARRRGREGRGTSRLTSTTGRPTPLGLRASQTQPHPRPNPTMGSLRKSALTSRELKIQYQLLHTILKIILNRNQFSNTSMSFNSPRIRKRSVDTDFLIQSNQRPHALRFIKKVFTEMIIHWRSVLPVLISTTSVPKPELRAHRLYFL